MRDRLAFAPLTESRLPQIVELERLEPNNSMTLSKDCPSGQSQFLTQPRRQFLASVFAIGTVGVLKSQPKILGGFSSQLPKPEFWFGDLVDFFWDDEETGESHSETGEVTGAVWDFRSQQWEYRVTWLYSTRHPDDEYPLYDGDRILAREVCKH